MSTKGIEAVLSRAMSDSAFADSLFVDPAKALAGFELTAEEIAKFHGISREGLSTMAGMEPEERKSRAVMIEEMSVRITIRDGANVSGGMAGSVKGALNHNEILLKIYR